MVSDNFCSDHLLAKQNRIENLYYVIGSKSQTLLKFIEYQSQNQFV